MSGPAADHYAARIDAIAEQRRRFTGDQPPGDRWASRAEQFRLDPRRPLDPNLAVLAEYVQPEDVVLDVGGGAGRMLLPLALRCREGICVDPSPAMEAQFTASAAEAGITNARFVRAAWPAPDVAGDVSIVANVTYFVREIVPFIEALTAATRRRVMITVWSVPPPSQDAALFRLFHGEEQELAPSYRELLPVLWELGILPDVRVLPGEFRGVGGLPRTREEAARLVAGRLEDVEPERIDRLLAERFSELFDETPNGLAPRWRPPARELLITWQTDI